MFRSLSERVTAQFYDWELRGRGWHTSEISVDLEPPFRPFRRYVAQPAPVPDDGKHPTILGWLVGALRPKEKPTVTEEGPEAIVPYFYERDSGLNVFSLVVPKGYKIGTVETHQLILMLSCAQYPVSFEIIASGHQISLQLVCGQSDAAYVQSQVKAYFPQCIVAEAADRIEEIVDHGTMGQIQEFGLREEFMRPLVTDRSFELDPFIGLFSAFEQLQEQEHAVIQVLFKGVVNPWAESILRSVVAADGKSSFFADAPDMVHLAQEKVASPLHAVVLRTLVSSHTEHRLSALGNTIQNSFVRIFKNSYNSLIPLHPAGEDFTEDVHNMLLRESNRLGMLLSSKELATIVHLPSESVVTPRLVRDTRKTKAAPKVTEGHALRLGTNLHAGQEKAVTVSTSQRLKHMHVIGATGSGKSTFLHSIICQDIHNGEGIAVLDPHGDLIEAILPHIPEERYGDVLVLDPADAEYPVGFNILSAYSEIEKDILSSDLVAVFKRLSTSWGDQMNSIFANAILAFLEHPKGGTLADLRRFLVEEGYRRTYLAGVTDPHIKYYWQREYPLLKSGSIGPILTRLDTFLRPKLIRNMVSQHKGLDFEHILDSKKIVLAKLSQGLIGVENSYLLGTFFITKFYQAAMARQAKGKEERGDYFLYVDEFQNFTTPSMSAILAGARKYHLGLVLAHQDMQQLARSDAELASSVVSNAGTRICFRLGDTDAKRFESGFSSFTKEDLENLHTGEAICRIERPDYDFNLTVVPAPATAQNEAQATTRAIIAQSRARYGTPKSELPTDMPVAEEPIELMPEQAPSPPKPKPAPAPPEPPPLPIEIPVVIDPQTEQKRKTETEHRYLQNLIKRMAESRGYVAKVEVAIPSGSGRVDVLLEHDKKRIACEICVTTEVEWELHNLEKCLVAGFDLIVCCASQPAVLERIQTAAQSRFTQPELDKVRFFQPEQLFFYLDEQNAQEARTEERINGYRVTVEYSATTESELKAKKDIIGNAIASAKRKTKNVDKK